MTDDAVLSRPDFREVAAAVLAAAGPGMALHVRGPGTGGALMERLTVELLTVAREAGAVLLVNDRVDVALGTGADGVHLGRRSVLVTAARALLGPGALLGMSVHDPDAATGALEQGADFAFLGAVYDTPSHPAGTVLGTDAVVAAVDAARGLPVLAIGGVTAERVAEVVASGGHGVAVLGGIWRAPDAPAAAVRYLDALEAASGRGSDQSTE